MIYWIPAIFIIFDFISLLLFGDINKGYNSNQLLCKYNDKELERYISRNYPIQDEMVMGFSVLLFFELIYFVVCLFYSFWFISIIVIITGLIYGITVVIKKEPIEKIIKRSKLNNFHSSDIKFDRLLKLNELNDTNDFGILLDYILMSLKMLVFMLIIVFHYNNININLKHNNIGYYNDTTILVDTLKESDKKESNKYITTIHIKETERYSNGLSKIELMSIDMIHGFELDQYDWIKLNIKSRFSTLKKTSDIKWLEIKK